MVLTSICIVVNNIDYDCNHYYYYYYITKSLETFTKRMRRSRIKERLTVPMKKLKMKKWLVIDMNRCHSIDIP